MEGKAAASNEATPLDAPPQDPLSQKRSPPHTPPLEPLSQEAVPQNSTPLETLPPEPLPLDAPSKGRLPQNPLEEKFRKHPFVQRVLLKWKQMKQQMKLLGKI